MSSDTLPPGLGGMEPSGSTSYERAVGRVLKGRYRLDSPLGNGAMGVVFRGTDTNLGKPVAVKMLRPDAFHSDEARERFEREAKTASMMVHPSIAQVFDYGIDGEVPFLVMELVDGKDLAEVIREEGPLQPARAVAIMRQLASVLDEAHKHGVVHRDIKPQNLKLMRYSSGGQLFLKVLDFGIAKRFDSSEGRLTATGAVIGTPMYMAPEQAAPSAEKPIDGRADLYAAGIVFYEMITGTVPFDAPSLAGVLMSHLTRPPPTLPREVPDPVRKVIMRLLRKEAADRFADASELDRALGGCETACRDAPPLPSSAVKPATYKRPTLGVRNVLVLGGGAMGVAVGTMIGALLLFPSLRQRGPAPVPIHQSQIQPDPATPKPEIKPPVTAPQISPPPMENDPRSGHKHHAKGPRQTGEGETAKPPATPETNVPAEPAHVALKPEAAEKLRQAQQAYRQKDYQDAQRLARQAQGAQQANFEEARLILALSYCAAGEQEGAQTWFRQLNASDRQKVIKRCQQEGIELMP